MGMRLKSIVFALAGVLLAAPSIAQTPDPSALLHEAVDRLRGPAMVATYTLEVERPESKKRYVLRIYQDGDKRALIFVVEPKRDAGQAFLMLDQDVWIYNPRLGRALRLPPSGRNDRFLGSDVSYADLSGRDLESMYEVGLEAGSREDLITLVLTPKPRAPTPWGKVTLELDSASRLPRKIVYYDQRNHPVKEITLRSYAEIAAGRYLATETLVQDLVHEGYRTLFTVTDWKVGPVPERCFSPSALQRGCQF